MSYFVFPREMSSEVDRALIDAGLHITSLDEMPRVADGWAWERRICRAGRHGVVVATAAEIDRPERFIAVLSLDLRRLPLVWRLPGDWRLLRRARQIMLELGAQEIDEEGAAVTHVPGY